MSARSPKPPLRTATQPSAPITDVAVLTRDRPACLERCLDRFISDSRGRELRFHVFDDAQDEQSNLVHGSIIEGARKRWGYEISHITRRDRARWIEALLQLGAGAITEEITHWALLGESSSELTGANRNAITLSMLDRVVMYTDDDMAPPAARMLDSGRGITVNLDGDPTEIHFFPTRGEALGTVERLAEKRSAIELHEELLGRSIHDAFAAHGQRVTSELRGGDARTSHVTISVCGLVGDAGMSSTFYFAMLNNSSRARWVKDWDRLRETREVVRGVPMATISGARFLMAANIALDARGWMPPFVPEGRNQDGPVALLLRHVAPNQYIGHLPFVLQHDPPTRRSASFEAALTTVRNPQRSHLLMMCISACPPYDHQSDSAARTARLGRFLIELTDDCDAFHAFLLKKALRSQQVRIGRLEDILASHSSEPTAWADHIRTLLRAANKSLRDPDYALPSDTVGTPAHRREKTMRHVRAFGKLLTQWPALREVAREARRQGKSLTP